MSTPLPDHGIRIAVQGTDNGTPVVFITGFMGLAGFWDPVTQKLPESCQLITYDQRGTGGSTAYTRPLSMKQLADDTLAVMDDLGLEDAYVVGHSMGACAAWILAAMAPKRLRGTYLVAGWDSADPWMKRVFETRLDMLRAAGPLAYARATTLFMNPPEVVNPADTAFSAAEEALAGALPPLAELQERTEAALAFQARDWQPDPGIPMRITCASDDWMTPIALSKNLSALHPQASTKWFETGGHYFPRSRAPELAADIADWLTKIA